MLHQARVSLLLLVVASAALAAQPPPAPVTLTLSPITDGDFRAQVLGARQGKAVLVSFWASYCAPCLNELPALLEMKRAVHKRGGDIVFVNVDPPGDPAHIHKLILARGLPAFDSFQVTNEDPQSFIDAVDKKWMGEIPYAVVFGRDGTLHKRLSGEQKIADLRSALDEVL